MQVENRDIGALWRRKSNRNHRLFELIARPATSDLLSGFPGRQIHDRERSFAEAKKFVRLTATGPVGVAAAKG